MIIQFQFRGLVVVVVGCAEVAWSISTLDLCCTSVLKAKVFAPPQNLQEKLGLDPSCVSYSAGVVTVLVWSVINEI